MTSENGKYIITAGFLLTVIGIIWYYFGDKLGFIGNLPGDVKIEKENFRFYFPFTTMILFSLLINVIIRLFRLFM